MSFSGLDTIQFYDYHPKSADFYADVMHGLQQEQKILPPKYFYDQRGSQLFDAICELPEYYQTRTETDILQQTPRYLPLYRCRPTADRTRQR